MSKLPGTSANSGKQPSACRLLGVLFALSTLMGSTAQAESRAAAAVTVEQAVSIALARPELAAALAGSGAIEDATAQRASIWPNPVIAYDREQVSVGEREATEETLVISQSLEFSGRRGLRADAARQRGQANRLDGEATRRRAAMETRRRFWRVAHLQSQHEVAQGWLTKLEEASQRVTKRKSAGESSTYDVLRVEREVRASRAALARLAVEREVSWLSLLELTGDLDAPGGWPRAGGSLLPKSIETPKAERATRPDVEAWAARERAAKLELNAANRGWLPEIGLSAGWRRVEDVDGSGEGFTAGVGLSLPLFDHGQADAAVARARAARARSMGALLADDARRQRRPAETRARELAKLARRVRAETETAARALEATAEAAWLGGELEILEILDVHRGRRDDALAVLEIEHAAREAREDLRAITLEETP
jgi:cobalt-zinc-cadmium efflux system outer membrane protein